MRASELQGSQHPAVSVNDMSLSDAREEQKWFICLFFMPLKCCCWLTISELWTFVFFFVHAVGEERRSKSCHNRSTPIPFSYSLLDNMQNRILNKILYKKANAGCYFKSLVNQLSWTWAEPDEGLVFWTVLYTKR